jgi:hypothetical protein
MVPAVCTVETFISWANKRSASPCVQWDSDIRVWHTDATETEGYLFPCVKGQVQLQEPIAHITGSMETQTLKIERTTPEGLQEVIISRGIHICIYMYAYLP